MSDDESKLSGGVFCRWGLIDLYEGKEKDPLWEDEVDAESRLTRLPSEMDSDGDLTRVGVE